MKGIRFLAVPVLACGLAMSMSASAQDMSFGLEETGQSRVPVKLGKPSKRLAAAQSAFEGKKYEEAAMGFERVSAGKSKDGRGNRQRAQFLLGQSLYQMGYYQSALTVFDDISAQGPGHIDFGRRSSGSGCWRRSFRSRPGSSRRSAGTASARSKSSKRKTQRSTPR